METPITAVVQAVSRFLKTVSTQSYFDYSIEAGLLVLGLLTAALVVARDLPLWAFLYVTTIAFALCGEWHALRQNPEMVKWF